MSSAVTVLGNLFFGGDIVLLGKSNDVLAVATDLIGDELVQVLSHFSIPNQLGSLVVIREEDSDGVINSDVDKSPNHVLWQVAKQGILLKGAFLEFGADFCEWKACVSFDVVLVGRKVFQESLVDFVSELESVGGCLGCHIVHKELIKRSVISLGFNPIQGFEIRKWDDGFELKKWEQIRTFKYFCSKNFGPCFEILRVRICKNSEWADPWIFYRFESNFSSKKVFPKFSEFAWFSGLKSFSQDFCHFLASSSFLEVQKNIFLRKVNLWWSLSEFGENIFNQTTWSEKFIWVEWKISEAVEKWIFFQVFFGGKRYQENLFGH